jgi:serine protease AprX
MEDQMTEQISQKSFSSLKLPGNIRLYLKKEEPEELELNDQEATDTLNSMALKSDYYTSKGKIPLIISNTSKEQIDYLKNQISDEFSPEEASIVSNLPIVGGFEVEVEPDTFAKLMKTVPPESSVIVDSKLGFPDPNDLIIETDKEVLNRPPIDHRDSTLNLAELWKQGYTGKGVGICVIDSGIYPHVDFGDRITKFVDMHEGKEYPYDPYGHGTYVAGIAAGSGISSDGLYRGIAPGAELIGVRITTVAEAIKAIQWATENKDEYNIKVMNLSLGDYPIKSYKDDPWSQAAEKAWDAGIVVVAASGNEGPDPGSISTPGINPKIITVGYIDDKNTPKLEDDEIPDNTSRGPTFPDDLEKPDLVAPGVGIHGPIPPDSEMERLAKLAGIGIYDTDNSSNKTNKNEYESYLASTGSSAATPMVAGTAAVLLEANPDLTPDEIKEIMTSTAINYIRNATPYDQGKGLLDPPASLEEALNLKDPPKPKDRPITYIIPANKSGKLVKR